MSSYLLPTILVIVCSLASASPSVEPVRPRDVVPDGLATANKWRSAFALPVFTWDVDLEDNAYETGAAGGGKTQAHQLPPANGAHMVGQVITPGSSTLRPEYGDMTPFEVAYLTWLCEVQTDPQTKDVCLTVAKVNPMTYSGTSHHDIVNNPSFTHVGCAFAPDQSADWQSPINGLYVCSFRSN
ncbi:hypothetical protein GQ53DRAFT_832572 [Thozetella sp. PMI_491]|nr:hypothetical protein GQ53DRAFT_832572 [Thozetella sp. PMI_491]